MLLEVQTMVQVTWPTVAMAFIGMIPAIMAYSQSRKNFITANETKIELKNNTEETKKTGNAVNGRMTQALQAAEANAVVREEAAYAKGVIEGIRQRDKQILEQQHVNAVPVVTPSINS